MFQIHLLLKNDFPISKHFLSLYDYIFNSNCPIADDHFPVDCCISGIACEIGIIPALQSNWQIESVTQDVSVQGNGLALNDVIVRAIIIGCLDS
jgi:hypothetical protein